MKKYIGLSFLLFSATMLQLNGMSYEEYKPGIVNKIKQALNSGLPLNPADVVILQDFLEENKILGQNPEKEEEFVKIIIEKADSIIAYAEKVEKSIAYAEKTKKPNPSRSEINTAVSGLLLIDVAARLNADVNKLPAVQKLYALNRSYFLAPDALTRKHRIQYIADENMRNMIQTAKHPIES